MEGLSVSIARRAIILFRAILLPMALTRCGKKAQNGEAQTAQKSEDDFLEVEAAHGPPRAPKMLHVFSTDPDVLNRLSKEQFGAMDSMFAVGAMPDWIPANIRRASLRGQIHTELSPQELQRVAAQEGISVEELKKSEDFDPYFNLKIVLVEEDGQLKVGYFEFLPPSVMD